MNTRSPNTPYWLRNGHADTLFAKLDAAKASGAKVFAMDIDAAGLPFLKGLNPPAGPKTVAEPDEPPPPLGL